MSDPNVIEQPEARPVVACSDLLGISERLKKLNVLRKDMNKAVTDIIGEISICETKIRAIKRAAKEDRLRLSLRLRSQGKTFNAIGDELGVSGGRAIQIFKLAERMQNRGRL